MVTKLPSKTTQLKPCSPSGQSSKGGEVQGAQLELSLPTVKVSAGSSPKASMVVNSFGGKHPA